MLKNILNIKGIQQLDRVKQKSINGGFDFETGCMTLSECQIQEVFCPNSGKCTLHFDGPVGGNFSPCYKCSSQNVL